MAYADPSLDRWPAMSTTAATFAVLAIAAAGGLLAWRITADTDQRDEARRRAARRRLLDELARHQPTDPTGRPTRRTEQ